MKQSHRKAPAFLLSALLTLALAAGCELFTAPEPPAGPVAVTGVSLPAAATVYVGGKGSLTATVSPANAANKTVTWSADTSAFLTIDPSSGAITVTGAGGPTVVTATTADGAKTASCTVTAAEPSAKSDLRSLPAALLAKAVCYSGYRLGTSVDTRVLPTDAEVKQDLDLLVAQGFQAIRIYDPIGHGEQVLRVIAANSIALKVLLGVWISGPIATADAANQASITKAIEFANDSVYGPLIGAVSVGNETMVDWSFQPTPPADMKTYIGQVRSAITQPVGTDDNYEPFTFVNEWGVPYSSAADLEQVARAVDFLALHTYALADPFYGDPYGVVSWDWKQTGVAEGPGRAVAMMDAALAYTKKNLSDARAALAGKGIQVPLVIGETGWTTTGKFVSNGAHPVNQKMYYDRLESWVHGAGQDSSSPLGLFYFEAFDEPWKGGDNHWGLYSVDRTPKYVLSGTGYTEADALYYKAPVVQGPVTESTYWLYGAGAPGTDVKIRAFETDWSWNSWENGTTASAVPVENGNEAGIGEAVQITPIPLDWGWGMTLDVKNPEDLTNYTAGHLVFQVKTLYPGSVEIGFLTGLPTSLSDVYIKVTPGSNTFGYKNDGTWSTVSIPIATLMPKAVPAWGMGSSVKINMAQVKNPLVIADRYANTAKTSAANGKGSTVPFLVDRIRWTKD